jgi:pilus assembly protein CpaC
MTLALLLAVALSAEPVDAPIRVGPGAQQVLKVSGLVRLAIADPTVADVTVTRSDELLILGRRTGRTTLTLWTRGKTITRPVIVDDGKFNEVCALIKEKVETTLKCEVYGDKLVIDGVVDSVDDFSRLRSIVADYPNVKLLVKLNPLALPALANVINTALKKAGLQNASVKVLGNRLVLEGSVSDEQERKKAQMIAESYYSDFAAK